jgi:hypothetical protein
MIDHRLGLRTSTVIAGALLLSGCAGGPTSASAQQALSVRAASDLGCSPSELQLEPVAGSCTESGEEGCVVAVRGCGSAARYLYSESGRWMPCHTSEQSWPICEVEPEGEGP